MKTYRPLLLLVALLAFGACKREEKVDPAVDNEAITTATLRLTNRADAADVVTATVESLDKTPNFTQARLTLRANATYAGVVLLQDKSKTPATDVTAEIKKLQNEHLLVYTPAAGLNLAINSTDRDTNPAPGPYPVGLTFDVVTRAASVGKLNVVLRHQPNSKNGTPAPGTTDLDTNFDVVIR